MREFNSTPKWWWYVLGGVLIIVIVVSLVQLLRKKKASDEPPTQEETEHHAQQHAQQHAEQHPHPQHPHPHQHMPPRSFESYAQAGGGGYASFEQQEPQQQKQQQQHQGGGDARYLDSQKFYTAIRGDTCVVAFVDTDNCGHCKQMEPAFKQAASQAAVPFYILEAKAAGHVLQKYQIEGLPTVMKFKEGNIIAQYQGDRSAQSFVEFSR